MGVHVVLFDNDGTLVDTHDLIVSSMTYATEKVLGQAVDHAAIMKKVGQPLAEQMKDYTDDPALQEELLRVYREHNHAHHDEAVKAFPGVIEGCAQLKEMGFHLGVVTAKMHWLAWHGLEVVGLAPYMECLVGADDCETFKPDEGPVLTAAEMLNHKPENCLYVGDSIYDIQSGNAAGATTAAVTWGMANLEELLTAQPHYVCESFDDVITLALALSDGGCC